MSYGVIFILKEDSLIMNVYLQSITGWDEALSSLYMTRGNWTPELSEQIHKECDFMFTRDGTLNINPEDSEHLSEEEKVLYDSFMNRCKMLFSFGARHTTMMRFIDFSFVIDGLHRGAQDDWDAHAKRYDNRIIRLSTRVTSMKKVINEGHDIIMSDYYKDKVLTLGETANILGMEFPEEFEYNGKTYVRSINGYVDKNQQSPDVKRGLYPLGLSSTFVFKCNLCEYPHVRSLRIGKTEGLPESGHAHPEIWELVKKIDKELIENIPYLTPEWLNSVKQ